MTVDDVAKRLIDYGFHAPTMSFPVAGTLMVEPTESRVQGRARPVLRRHDRHPRRDRPGRARASGRSTTTRCTTPPTPPRTWPPTTGTRPYTRELAAYPVASLRRAKYWPPVGRIDGAYGDRNLVCSCPPIEAYA